MAAIGSTPPGAPSSGVTTPRYIPGVHPPVSLSKSKKKKTRSALKNLAASAHEAGLSDQAPDAENTKAGGADPLLLANLNPAPRSNEGANTGNNVGASSEEKDAGRSMEIEAISKRIKALGKQVQRATEYKDETKVLNEDQKAALARLPGLEAAVKELEAVKKALEAFETTQYRPQAQQYTQVLKPSVTTEGQEARNSLAINVLTRRIKALSKKVQRAKSYMCQTRPLNTDQQALVAQLPSLKATVRALEGVKKTIETIEMNRRRTREQQPPRGLNATDHYDDSDEVPPRGLNATDRCSDSGGASLGGLNATDYYDYSDEAPLGGLNAANHCSDSDGAA